MYVLPAAEKHI